VNRIKAGNVISKQRVIDESMFLILLCPAAIDLIANSDKQSE